MVIAATTTTHLTMAGATSSLEQCLGAAAMLAFLGDLDFGAGDLAA
jgi:hypothetical protein